MKFTRNQIWKHNGLLGSARMAYLFAQNVQSSPTTTDESRRIAFEAAVVLERLSVSLKTRRDQVQ